VTATYSKEKLERRKDKNISYKPEREKREYSKTEM